MPPSPLSTSRVTKLATDRPHVSGRRRLVVCCDGTWNQPDEVTDGLRAPTNVAKLALGVPDSGRDGTPQLLFYQHGVGTRRFEHVRGGAFGYGLSRNVRECYRFIVENYRPGDDLYFFGFSRGAYTARSTVGLIRNCGILRAEHQGRLAEAYRLYRSRATRKTPGSLESQLFRRMYSYDDVPIHFIGVWDTVGALGIPIDGLRIPFIGKFWGFHDTELSCRVRSAYQALAIDEERGAFKPAVWTRGEAVGHQTLEQVWFAGVHSDVGGGYADPSLAEIPLLWMVQNARDCGLEFDSQHFQPSATPPADESRYLGKQLVPDALGKINKSRKGFYLLMPRYRRPLTDDGSQSIASSAVRRIRERSDYDPPNAHAWVDAKRRQSNVTGSLQPAAKAA
jgi:uncharacterized protein (DUF2235 family)